MKEFLKKELLKSNDQSIIVESKDCGGHRHPLATIGRGGEWSTKLFVKTTNFYGYLCKLGIEVAVKDYPEMCLEQIIANDDPMCGQPHHYELNEDNTAVLYIRHGTTPFGETSHRFIEKTITTMVLYTHIKEEELDFIAESDGAYSESLKKTICLAANAVKALAY